MSFAACPRYDKTGGWLSNTTQQNVNTGRQNIILIPGKRETQKTKNLFPSADYSVNTNYTEYSNNHPDNKYGQFIGTALSTTMLHSKNTVPRHLT